MHETMSSHVCRDEMNTWVAEHFCDTYSLQPIDFIVGVFFEEPLHHREGFVQRPKPLLIFSSFTSVISLYKCPEGGEDCHHSMGRVAQVLTVKRSAILGIPNDISLPPKAESEEQ